MNNDNKGGCLAIVLGGILFILGPIVVILYGLISAPIGMKVFLLSWIIAVVLCNTFISDKSTRITLSIIPTVIYAFSFAAWYADDVLDGYYGGGGLGDTIGMFLLACATLVPLMLIGQAIRSTLEQKKQEKEKKKTDEIKQKISSIEQEIIHIKMQLQNRRTTVHLLNLLGNCGGQIDSIKSHPSVDNIYELNNNIVIKQKQIQMLQAQLK